MTTGAYTDDFGVTAPTKVTGAGRRIVTDDVTFGIEIGQRAPDIYLPSASGVMVDMHRSRNGAKACVVFFRSAVW